jgi:cyclophilin family peptidyl-prolyl cis-trans isomerase
MAAPVLGEEYVVLETNHGDIKLELYEEKAPVSVENFLQYVENGFYEGTIFHRVIKDFMIQGGGFTTGLKQKQNLAPIRNEADNGLKNDRGTIAMARTNVVDSATSQFFINLKDNDFLNHTGKNPRGYGYAVFGKVVEGMDVVDRIGSSPTRNRGGAFQNLPTETISIKSARKVER